MLRSTSGKYGRISTTCAHRITMSWRRGFVGALLLLVTCSTCEAFGSPPPPPDCSPCCSTQCVEPHDTDVDCCAREKANRGCKSGYTLNAGFYGQQGCGFFNGAWPVCCVRAAPTKQPTKQPTKLPTNRPTRSPTTKSPTPADGTEVAFHGLGQKYQKYLQKYVMVNGKRVVECDDANGDTFTDWKSSLQISCTCPPGKEKMQGASEDGSSVLYGCRAIVSSWTTIANHQCSHHEIGDTYFSLSSAKSACAATAGCTGVYDNKCNGGKYHLCNSNFWGSTTLGSCIVQRPGNHGGTTKWSQN